MVDKVKAAESFLKDTPDWIKLLGVMIIVWGVDRYGSMASDVEQIKQDVSVMSTSLLLVQTSLGTHEREIQNLKESTESHEKAIRSLQEMTEMLWRKIKEQETKQ